MRSFRGALRYPTPLRNAWHEHARKGSNRARQRVSKEVQKSLQILFAVCYVRRAVPPITNSWGVVKLMRKSTIAIGIAAALSTQAFVATTNADAAAKSNPQRPPGPIIQHPTSSSRIRLVRAVAPFSTISRVRPQRFPVAELRVDLRPVRRRGCRRLRRHRRGGLDRQCVQLPGQTVGRRSIDGHLRHQRLSGRRWSAGRDRPSAATRRCRASAIHTFTSLSVALPCALPSAAGHVLGVDDREPRLRGRRSAVLVGRLPHRSGR